VADPVVQATVVEPLDVGEQRELDVAGPRHGPCG
jgi:hypothetical protein